jgi:SsrA-binding protein
VKNVDLNIIASNRKALHDYFILDRIEAGIVLTGTEVKSLRARQVNLKDSYAKIVGAEIYLINCHISPYSHGGYDNHEPERKRKLLLQKMEIRRLQRSIETKSVTLVPLKMYFNAKGIVKVELGIAKGKRQYDKRTAISERDSKRELDRIGRGEH